MNGWKEHAGALPPALTTGLGTTPIRYGDSWWAKSGEAIMRFVGGGSIVSRKGHRIGLGALTDSALQSAAAALFQELTSQGCTDGFSATVQAFQQAFVAAGGQLPNDSNGSSGIDGLYGANTQAALQATLDVGTLQPPPAAPDGCVPVASTGPAVAPGGQTLSTNLFGLPTWAIWGLGIAIVGGASLIAWSVLSKGPHHRAMHGHHARQVGEGWRRKQHRHGKKKRKGRTPRRHRKH